MLCLKGKHFFKLPQLDMSQRLGSLQLYVMYEKIFNLIPSKLGCKMLWSAHTTETAKNYW